MRHAHRVLVGKPERRVWHGTQSSKPGGEDNIKTNLKGMEWEGVDWTHFVQKKNTWRTVVNTVMNFRVQYKADILFNKRWTRSQSVTTPLREDISLYEGLNHGQIVRLFALDCFSNRKMAILITAHSLIVSFLTDSEISWFLTSRIINSPPNSIAHLPKHFQTPLTSPVP
jgi:hypothetical protein